MKAACLSFGCCATRRRASRADVAFADVPVAIDARVVGARESLK